MLDELLWQALKELPVRSVAAIEALPIWPSGTMFHRAPVSSRPLHAAWADAMCRQLADCDLVFIDPDNGWAAQHLAMPPFKEIRALRRPGRTIVLIKFPGRVAFNIQADAYHIELQAGTGASRIMMLRSFRGRPRHKWPQGAALPVVHPA